MCLDVLFVLFGLRFLESIIICRIDFRKNKKFLLSVRIIFREIIKYKLFYLKINFIKLILFKINSTKIELNLLRIDLNSTQKITYEKKIAQNFIKIILFIFNRFN